jgi:hypothetical protein
MAIPSTRSRCPAESDLQRETAQISADPSSAFDGDGEPRLNAARAPIAHEGPSGRGHVPTADALLAEAERFFNAFWSAPMVPGVESLAWGECCTDTVRRWVAVAREAARS